jgi:hypothetical protein
MWKSSSVVFDKPRELGNGSLILLLSWFETAALPIGYWLLIRMLINF